MNRNDLRRVDMNLLVIFEALMFEKNLTRVAEKLFMGQPAVSAALGRLRDLFDDPLLLRNGRGMEPTPRAVAILKELQPAMDTISGAVSRAKDFDPSTSCAVFRIGLSDDAEFGLFPPLLSQLREEAPGIIVVVRRANYLLMSSLLASGEITVGVSYTTDLPANAKRKKLRDIPCKVLRGDGGTAPLSLDEYCERPLHGKVAVVDDRWATVGSSNLDPLSLALNLEANVLIHDQAFNQTLRAKLDHLITHACKQIDRETIGQPSKLQLLRSYFIFHLLRRYPTWLGGLPRHAPQLVAATAGADTLAPLCPTSASGAAQ